MEILKLCIGSFETLEQAQAYRNAVNWYSNVDITKDNNTGKFGVYIYEAGEFLCADIKFRTDIFYQDAYFTFGQVIFDLNA